MRAELTGSCDAGCVLRFNGLRRGFRLGKNERPAHQTPRVTN